MNCDLILSESSCRFCLCDAGSNVSVQGYFLVEKRLVSCQEIFDSLELRISENVSPNVPKNICDDCKKTIVAFYALRKTFLDNEAVLMGTVAVPDRRQTLRKEVEVFLKEHEKEQLKVETCADQLVIRLEKLESNRIHKRSPSEDDEQSTLVLNKQEDLHEVFLVQTEEGDLNTETQNEEYLEDDSVEYNNETSIIYDEIQYELQVSKDSQLFECQLCDRKFESRSGRDTHNQLKHKAPADLESTSVDEHEIETELGDGSVAKAWKCPICQLVSKKKSHHQTHMIRHAIREKQNLLKLGIHPACSGASEEIATKPEFKKVLLRMPINHTSHVFEADDYFSCSSCKAKFAEIEDAKSHVQKYARKGMCADCFCKDCSVVFSSQRLYKRHVEFHDVSSLISSLSFPECSKCQIIFGSFKDLEVHLGTNHLCETDRTNQLEGAELLFFGLQPDMSSQDYRCGCCIKTGTKDDVKFHMTLFHLSLICPIDKQEFGRYAGYFMEHVKLKHPQLFGDVKLNFRCPHCDQNFSTKAAKDEHCFKCDSKSFLCLHCDKRFAFERQLKRHMSLVKGIKSQKCEFCQKSFVNRTELNVHVRSHTNEKPYFCSFPGCEKSFRTNSHRSAHLDIHNQEKNFKCSKCDELFQTRSLRRIHEKSHSIGSITCEMCQKEFGQRSHYVRHINKVHHIPCTSLNLEESIRQHNNIKEAAV